MPAEIVTSPSELVARDQIRPHPQNPNVGDVDAIADSMAENGVIGSIVVQRSTGFILGGSHTWEAAGRHGLGEVSVQWVDCDDRRAKRIMLALNRTRDFATYDDARLAELLAELQAEDPIGLSGSGFDDTDLAALAAELNLSVSDPGGEPGGLPERGPSLAERFLIPPFSVLDARQGYWRDRKRQWLDLGIRSWDGRPANDLKLSADDEVEQGTQPNRSKPSTTGNDPEFYWKKQAAERRLGRDLTTAEFLEDHYEGPDVYREGTSVFDPVLAEVVYRWFAPPAGRVLDPLAGGSVRGIVASRLGLPYVGIDLSPMQVEANEAQRHLAVDPQPEWIVGDARDTETLTAGPFDLLFTCPPYFDLERYSDDPADLANAPTWDAFCDTYTQAIAASTRLLADDRFAVIVVGNVRDRRGELLDLADATTRAMTAAGLTFYNDAVLVTNAGSLALRAARSFALRKLGRCHQQVLVYLRGDAQRAVEALGAVDVPAEVIAAAEAAVSAERSALGLDDDPLA